MTWTNICNHCGQVPRDIRVEIEPGIVLHVSKKDELQFTWNNEVRASNLAGDIQLITLYVLVLTDNKTILSCFEAPGDDQAKWFAGKIYNDRNRILFRYGVHNEKVVLGTYYV